MTNDIATKQNGDGFDSFEAGTEGETQFDSVIKGQLLKFSNTAAWVAGEEELPKDIELLAVDIIRVVQRWVDGRPAETKILGPGERFPNVAAKRSEVGMDRRANRRLGRSVASSAFGLFTRRRKHEPLYVCDRHGRRQHCNA